MQSIKNILQRPCSKTPAAPAAGGEADPLQNPYYKKFIREP